jgi:hypothetical protein
MKLKEVSFFDVTLELYIYYVVSSMILKVFREAINDTTGL